MAEDHFLPEIISIENQEILREGKVGELVMTSLTKEAMPIIRYRTGDITCINYEPCACGRTHARIDKIKGRVDDMIIVKGVNVFPSQVENAIAGIAALSPHYMLVVQRDGIMDSLEVKLELKQNPQLMGCEEKHRLETILYARLRSLLGLRVKVTLVAPKSLERFQGKAKHVIDLRNI